MEIFHIALLLTTLLCSLTAGFLFAFACVAMPGLGELNDREFIRAFQVIDRVIQNQQPLFMLVWVGSVVTLLASGFLGFKQLEGMEQILLIASVLIYLFGVQLPTVAINVPANNQLQAVDTQSLDDSALAEARMKFEPRWNRSNVVRTLLAVLISSLLIFLVFRL